MSMEIKKVLFNKQSKQKYVIIPKNSIIKEGDYVRIGLVDGGEKSGEDIKEE
jgi:hypothetical protein